MKVALLCASLEPGRDGVGDYVRQFAGVLTRQGHACQIVALADRFAAQGSESLDPEHGFQVVRLPYADWQRGCVDLAVDQISRFQPRWASLQMVCYGFEQRGMLWRSAQRFAQLRLAPFRHMMLHELWIGAWCTSTPKERAMGWLQRRLLLRAIGAWGPRVVHTSNALYREMLRRVNVTADELAIPGNIPVNEFGRAGARDRLVHRVAGDRKDTTRLLVGGLFGHLPPELAQGEWLEHLAAICNRNRRELVIVQMGRSGPGGAGVISVLRRRTAGRLSFIELGELPSSEVSAVLQGLDFGIATTPWSLIGKSGTAAAMLEHGLPVLVAREGEVLRGGSTPPPLRHSQLFGLSDFCEALRNGELQRVAANPRTDAYKRFISALERTS